MSKLRTYVDANVLIAAFRGTNPVSTAAMNVLQDPDRELVVSDALWLEIFPKPLFHRRADKVAFFDFVFGTAVQRVGWSTELTAQAANLAPRYGLAAMDAIHIAAAIVAPAGVLVTGEKPTKPMLSVSEIRVESLQPSPRTQE